MKQQLKAWLNRGLGRPGSKPPSQFIRVAYHTPRQVVLLTARHEEAENVWPVDWHIPLSEEPPLYGVSANRTGYGTSLIRDSGVFVLNFVPATWEETIFYCGRTSGREVDKFAQAGLAKEEAQTVAAPRLAQALGWLECRVEQCYDVGDHLFFVALVTLARQAEPAAVPRLHHLDSGLAELAEDFE